MLANAPIDSRATQRHRCLRLETLEPRTMLSHPTVVAVNVASTEWATEFVSYLESHGLGTGGYAISAGANQLKALPWNNINKIRITFSEDVVVTAADLSISGKNTTAYAFSGFTYDANTCTAIWTLAEPLPKDKLMLDLDADGMAPVVSVASGEVLDGAWVNCQSSFPSGDGEGGTDFEFRFNALPGDANGSNSVSAPDIFLVNQQIGKTTNDANYNYRCDIDGSGVVTTADFNAVVAKLGSLLPSGDPAGMTDDAPTTSGIPDLSVATGTTDYVLSLTDFFADAETAAADLAYSIVGNTNSSLFDSFDINAEDELDLSFASDITGDATLTIRATDPTGIFVDTTVTVHVSDAPFIAHFFCISEGLDYWTISGCVGDDDDLVEGYVITFGGVLAGYNLTAIVGEDGVFAITVELPGLQSGTATAQTSDPHGVLSNLAEEWIIV